MTSKTRAPDGKPWPLPYVAVDTSEQAPWAMGFVPAPWRDNAPVHLGEAADPGYSLVNQLLDGPWPSTRSNLETGDYQLLDGHGNPLPPDRAPCIERKNPSDLIGSLTAGHDRFIDGEMPRLAAFRTPVVIAEASIEWLIGGRSPALLALFTIRGWAEALIDQWMAEHPPENENARENFAAARDELRKLDGMLSGLRYEREAHRSGHKVRALLGSLLSIFTDHRVLPLALPDRRWAEYAAAWILRRGWRRWLTEEWDAGRRESIEAVRAQRAAWVSPTCPRAEAAA